jgi:hypothetical protein
MARDRDHQPRRPRHSQRRVLLSEQPSKTAIGPKTDLDEPAIVRFSPDAEVTSTETLGIQPSGGTAPVSRQKRPHRNATNAIEIKQTRSKINEAGRYPAAHNGLVAGSSPAGPTNGINYLTKQPFCRGGACKAIEGLNNARPDTAARSTLGIASSLGDRAFPAKASPVRS